MTKIKKTLILFIFFPMLLIAQGKNQENILEAEFAYFSKAKLNKTTSYMTEEIFLLQVLKDKAYFFSENMAKNDSIIKNAVYTAFATTPKGQAVHISPSNTLKNKYDYVITQSKQGSEYMERLGTPFVLFSYKEPIITDWKLVDEKQNINLFDCKKATLYYKGRNWTAWYDENIPLPYGPYTFTGLPGLIIKIESEDGDFSFELVKSTPKNKLNGKKFSLRDSRYKNPTPATFAEMRKIKKNTIERLVIEAAEMGVSNSTKDLLDRQKRRLQNFENENLIEKTE